jgi:peroxiredoxin Q/BCP
MSMVEPDTAASAKALLSPGETAPDFTLPDQDGRPFRLAEQLGRPVVLFFYPKDDSAVCSSEACSFRDDYGAFEAAGAEVLGISRDSAESHRAFAGKHGLPYRLLTDADGEVQDLYRVRKLFGTIPGRATFVVDAQGIIRHAFAAALFPQKHVRGALEAVRKLR